MALCAVSREVSSPHTRPRMSLRGREFLGEQPVPEECTSRAQGRSDPLGLCLVLAVPRTRTPCMLVAVEGDQAEGTCMGALD